MSRVKGLRLGFEVEHNRESEMETCIAQGKILLTLEIQHLVYSRSKDLQEYHEIHLPNPLIYLIISR